MELKECDKVAVLLFLLGGVEQQEEEAEGWSPCFFFLQSLTNKAYDSVH